MRETLPLRGQAVLFLGAHLTESDVEPIRSKQRIITKASVATRRPHGDAIDAAFEILDMTIRPGKAECGNEMCATLFRRLRPALDQQSLDAIHSGAEILVGLCPARRMDAGFAVERIDDQPGIVGERGLLACTGCG